MAKKRSWAQISLEMSHLAHEYPDQAREAVRDATLLGVTVTVNSIDAPPNRGDGPLVDTGELRNSVKWEFDESEGVGRIWADAPHAAPTEYGTRPFFPPVEPLQIWAMRKLGKEEDEAREIAYQIARTFSARGMNGWFWMANARGIINEKIVPKTFGKRLGKVFR